MSESQEPIKPSPTLVPPPRKPKPETVSLKEAIVRGWDWVVFSWQTLSRLGGPVQILKSLWTVLSMMVQRTLVQWGILKSKSTR